jgi:lactoylglutathione lyase
MKRFHVHVHVEDLAKNIAFYSTMFGAQPARIEQDYAKWMLDEPAVNFAISTRGHGHTGVDHLGIQVDNDADLAAMKAQAQSADLALVDEGATTCCYARSEKHWVVDPQGVPWEHFRTLGSIPTFSAPTASDANPCCTPAPSDKRVAIPIKQTGTGCC